MIRPMRYPGGKGKTFQHLINLMPPHSVYIETHLGGGAVMRNKRAARHSIGIERDESVINRWKRTTAGLCELLHAKAEDFLASYPFAGGELVYCDPPYIRATRRSDRVYAFEYSDEEHEALLRILRSLPCKVIVSGYKNELYDRLLKDWNHKTFSAMSHTGIRQESVWFNFEEPRKLHDASFVGANFRHRQTVKRRMQRLQAKLAGLDPIERHALMDWLGQTYPQPLEGA